MGVRNIRRGENGEYQEGQTHGGSKMKDEGQRENEKGKARQENR